MLKKNFFVLIFLCFIALYLKAQEEIGYTPSNYSGVQGLFLNPAKGTDAKTFLDVNLIGLNVFFHNNYIYFDRSEFYLWRNINTGFPDLKDNTKDEIKQVQLALQGTGPSLHLSAGIHSVGLFTRARNYTSVRLDLPLAKHIFEGFKYLPQLRQEYDLKNMYLNSLTWLEYGLSYGLIFYRRNQTMMSAGVNGKYLNGIHALGLNMESVNYMVLDSNDMQFYNFDGQYHNVNPALGSGRGWAVDLGFEYKRMLDDVSRYSPNNPKGGCKRVDYKWKIGVSALDMGNIRFTKNAVYQDFRQTGALWEGYDSTGIGGYGGIDSLLNSEFNTNGSITRLPEFRIWLPWAGSVQFDYNFGHYLYLNATALYGGRIGNNVRRGSLIAITPRYERKRWEVSIPFSLWDFRYPQFGIQIRLNNMLIIGSDRIMPLLYPSNVYGLDIYFHLKFSLFKNPACGKRNRGRSGKKSHSECPAYSLNRL